LIKLFAQFRKHWALTAMANPAPKRGKRFMIVFVQMLSRQSRWPIKSMIEANE
jgi:hypothetical protein